MCAFCERLIGFTISHRKPVYDPYDAGLRYLTGMHVICLPVARLHGSSLIFHFQGMQHSNICFYNELRTNVYSLTLRNGITSASLWTSILHSAYTRAPHYGAFVFDWQVRARQVTDGGTCEEVMYSVIRANCYWMVNRRRASYCRPCCWDKLVLISPQPVCRRSADET